MVTPCSSPASSRSPASLLTDTTKRARKEAKLAPAARNQKVPELSAREANTRPERNSNGLNPRISIPACLFVTIITEAMLTPASDITGPPGGAAYEEAISRGAA